MIVRLPAHSPTNMTAASYKAYAAASFWAQWVDGAADDAPTAAAVANAYSDVLAQRDAWWAARALMNGVMFHCGTRRAASRYASTGTATYVYRFDRDCVGAHCDPTPTDAHIGVSHGSELPYVFAAPTARATISGARLSDMIVTYWARFAATGDPNGRGAAPHWPRFGADERQLVLNASDVHEETQWGTHSARDASRRTLNQQTR
jgi:para-nitrobenzyl esterase